MNILFGWAGEDASSIASIDLSINVENALFTTVQVVFSPLQRNPPLVLTHERPPFFTFGALLNWWAAS
ncbi:hypothetical protein CO663_32165 [Rhizobium anhuiense]|nr:hypothetical protein CO663_32165 [Rhizobium anhuiense]